MSTGKGKGGGTPGDQIFTKVSVLVFLGVFLMGLGAELPLWTAVYRAFFVWLVVSLLGGAVRVGWKYHLYQQREHDLHANLNRAKEQEERLIQERRIKREQATDQFNELLNVVDEGHKVRGSDEAAGR